ncbi:MAG: hypothetical protein AD742_14350 [Methylibium sp. NZG]|nr:MAG: hypothetical protein AD742_14350 [Methylibium sp. NZG]
MRSAANRYGAPLFVLMASLGFHAAMAKLPVPVLTDEAKAKAAEAAAKTALTNKMADFQLCKSMDKAAAKYFASMKAAGKEVKPATETPPCVDPSVAAAAPATAAPTTPAAPAAVAAKKS